MSNISLKCGGAEIILLSKRPIEISSGPLKLTLLFNDKGGFALTQNGATVASAGAAATVQGSTLGAVMPDGTVYAGISPDTGRAFYATAQDEPEALEWKDALKRAASKDAHGHKDWRVPTARELNVLFNNRAAIGGFNSSGSYPAGSYWSSSENVNGFARHQRFSDGDQGIGGKYISCSSVRCVRG